MSNPLVAGVGRIVSADIAVPEHDRELSFYSRVLTTGERCQEFDPVVRIVIRQVVG